MNKVFFPLGPNAKNQAHRGVGRYYQYLRQALEKYRLVDVVNKIDQAQIVHYTYFDLYFASLPLQFAKPDYRTVVTIHDLIPLVFPDQYQPGKKGRLAFAKQKLALKKVDHFITDSQASQADLIKYLGLPADKISVIPLAANPELKPAGIDYQQEVMRRYQLKPNFIFYVGDINYNKNIPQLIKALKFLPTDVQLVCVGKNFIPQPIPEWQAISDQIKLSDVAQRVVFLTDILGSEADQILSALYSSCLAYVQPSLYEGFGLPILEAMQCGALVVCARNSSLPEVGGDAAFYVDQPLALNFAQQIKEIYDFTPTQLEKSRQKSLKHAATFSWKKTAVATNLVYQNLLRT